jgi:hypothetical protein
VENDVGECTMPRSAMAEVGKGQGEAAPAHHGLLAMKPRMLDGAFQVKGGSSTGTRWRGGVSPGRRAFAILVAEMPGAAVVAAVGLDSFKARLREAKSSAEVVEEDLRDLLNRRSAAMPADHPVLGVGWNHFGLLNSRPWGDRSSEILKEWDRGRGFTIHDENDWANPLTESLYWLWPAETGWLGFGGVSCCRPRPSS